MGSTMVGSTNRTHSFYIRASLPMGKNRKLGGTQNQLDKVER